MDEKNFGTVDYVIFGAILLFSIIIGVFFAYKQRKKVSAGEYLVASRSVSWFPIFASLVASFISASGVMGYPAQIYSTGYTFCFSIISFIIPIALCAEVFTPTFRELKLISVNEYLERRFSTGVRIYGCLLFHLQYILYLAIVMYTPSLAMESVADVPLYITILSTGFVCTFYTSLGGMKAVIWTDLLQFIIMIGGLVTVAVIGVIEVGSFQSVLDILSERERLTIDFDPDPRALHSFWGVTIGLTFSTVCLWTVSQPTAQRAVAARSLKDAKKALYWSFGGLLVISGLLTLDGFIIYATYADCDLLKSGKITRNDQILPYFVVNKLGHLTGIPGLFTACLFSFSLSTLSSGLNGMSALFSEDIVMKIYPRLSDKTGTTISKIAALVFGMMVTGLSFIVPYLGKYVLRIVIQLSSIIGSPYFSMFAMGFFTKTANSIGVAFGSFIGVVVGMTLVVGQLLYPPARNLPPISVIGCSTFNSTGNSTSGVTYPKDPVHDSSLTRLFSISYTWFAMIVMIISLVLGMLVSICTNSNRNTKDIDEILLYNYRKSFIVKCCRRRRSHSGFEATSLIDRGGETAL